MFSGMILVLFSLWLNKKFSSLKKELRKRKLELVMVVPSVDATINHH